jgi:hypothetical protein
MADPLVPAPALLVVASFSRHAEALAWAEDRLRESFGEVALVSLSYDFNQTAYYEASMGPELRKRLVVHERLCLADGLADVKRRTNELERELACLGRFPEPRPLNLDPGFLTLGKFMLATTKDQAHRIYLGNGVYAEVTLRFQAGAFEPWPWTYADYRQPLVRAFLKEARDFLRQRLSTEARKVCDIRGDKELQSMPGLAQR